MDISQIKILTVLILGNKLKIKYRSKDDIEKYLDERNINVDIKSSFEILKGKKVKKIGKKTFEVSYINKAAKYIVEEMIEKGCKLIIISDENEYIKTINKVDREIVSYNLLEKIPKSKKYNDLYSYIYERLAPNSIKFGLNNSNKNNDEMISISNVTKKKYKNNKAFKRDVDYARLYEENEIIENLIMYESFHGKGMSDSPYAIFKELINDDNYKDYKHIWVLNDTKNCRSKYLLTSNVEIVSVGSEEYLQYLTSCKYLINNTTFPPYFIRKENQVYLNTWHGTPLKTLGKYMKGERGQYKNIQRNLLQSTHLLNPNKFTADIMLDSHDIRGIFNGYISDIGYPRIDLTLKCNKEVLKSELDLEKDKKIILYAPTWRGEVGNVNSEVEKFISDYEVLQESYSDEYTILLRTHSLMVKSIKEKGYGKYIVPEYIDTNELLGIVDLLITDYSSIMFDYMVTKNPIILYCFDKEKYEEERGFLFDIEEVPGIMCKTIEEVINSINNIKELNNINKKKYANFLDKFNYMDDGKATERAIDYIFKEDLKNAYKVKDNKQSIIMYCGGFLNNGITTSAINLLDNINYEKYNVVVVDKGSYNEESDNNISKLNPNAKILYRVGNMLPLLKEVDVQREIFAQGLKKNIFEEKEMINLYNREMKRLVGDCKFDIAIDFSGYVKFWTLLFACSDIERKAIYQHNEMMEEYKKVIDGKLKHKANLDVIFPLYNNYDVVVSVAEHTCKVNKENLYYLVDNIEEKFDYVHNSINYKKVLESKDEDNTIELQGEKYYIKNIKENNNGTVNIETFKAPSELDINFSNVGRMSPEKDQKKLIRAFERVAFKYDNMKLYIMGDGVLRNELEKLISDFKLQSKVILTGQVSNPFALINKCNCFVLSSNHEGQPMVLLENLILNKDIIATDIPGNRSVLEGGYGVLVENNEEKLAEALKDYVENGIKERKEFDYIKYNEDAMKMFYKKVCNEK